MLIIHELQLQALELRRSLQTGTFLWIKQFSLEYRSYLVCRSQTKKETKDDALREFLLST